MCVSLYALLEHYSFPDRTHVGYPLDLVVCVALGVDM